jgi:hypothetical protein
MPAPDARRPAPAPRSHVVAADAAELVRTAEWFARMTRAGRVSAFRLVAVVDGQRREVAVGGSSTGDP